MPRAIVTTYVTSQRMQKWGDGSACWRSAKALERAGTAADPEYSLTNASALADSKICSEASHAAACIFVIRGCMVLLSLVATYQLWRVPLKAGLSTYKGLAPDCLQRPLRARFRQQVSASVGRH